MDDEKEIKESLKQIITNLAGDAKWYDYARLDSQQEILENIFENYFNIIEGFTCCCDKARYVTRKLLESVKNKEVYSLSMTYRESAHKDRIPEDEWDNVCYWCPVTIENTEDAFHVYRKMINPKWVAKLLEEKSQIYKEKMKL